MQTRAHRLLGHVASYPKLGELWAQEDSGGALARNGQRKLELLGTP